jgi:predicted DCC family thiol-disulfide oxidoreductase YuxK
MITALFDGYCVICQSTKRVIKALDWGKRVEFLDLHAHDAVRHRYPHLDHSELMGEIHVIDEAGDLYAGFIGTRRMLREVPLGYPLWLILQLPGMMWVGKRVYAFIARNRYAVNRAFGVDLAACEDGACKLPE